ncbi:MAG: N utilization substance protein B [Pirellulaceae bacterium]|nr:MAG: N utilization substance protein B [Pirellulaceae bacterium]
MRRRSRAREVALQLLYEEDLNPTRPAEAVEEFLNQRLGGDVDLIQFARRLMGGVRRNRAEIDAALRSAAEHWTLERMAVIDRNILRIGTYELLYTDIPGQVAINEAVELAKRYGGAQSPSFVNGILDRLLREFRGGASPGGDR